MSDLPNAAAPHPSNGYSAAAHATSAAGEPAFDLSCLPQIVEPLEGSGSTHVLGRGWSAGQSRYYSPTGFVEEFAGSSSLDVSMEVPSRQWNPETDAPYNRTLSMPRRCSGSFSPSFLHPADSQPTAAGSPVKRNPSPLALDHAGSPVVQARTLVLHAIHSTSSAAATTVPASNGCTNTAGDTEVEPAVYTAPSPNCNGTVSDAEEYDDDDESVGLSATIGSSNHSNGMVSGYGRFFRSSE